MKKQDVLPTDAVKKPNFSLIDENFLKSRIYTIRGLRVMLDADLAEIYGYSTKRFNEQVKNNIEKFDDDFRFQLTSDEVTTCSRSKKSTSSWGGQRYAPYAFTEQGIYMLMTVLKGEQAVAQSKALIRLFKQMKDYIVAENRHLLGYDEISRIAVQTERNTKDIAIIQSDLQKVMENFIDPTTYKHFLILDGQKLESDIAYTQIYSKAKKSILIIDRYLGVKTLDLLRDIAKGVLIKIISDTRGCAALTRQIQDDFKTARPDVNLEVLQTERKLHDRYVFLDYGTPDEKLFHCGASSKDGGNRIMTIMQVECPEVYHTLVDSLSFTRPLDPYCAAPSTADF